MKEKIGVLRFSFVKSLLLGALALLAGSAFAGSNTVLVNPPGRPPAEGKNVAVAWSPLGRSMASNIIADPPVRIAFAPGTTSGVYDGSLASGAVKSYVLNAAWNQVMIVNAATPDNRTYLEMYGLWDGYYLSRFSSAITSWQGWLPRSGDYIVKVYNGGGSAENYSLSVKIPARIRFAPGAYSGSVYGRGSAAQTISYVLYARAGQTMTATLSSSTGTVYLSIYGFSGGQSLVASTSSMATWTGVLPQTQEYIIDIVQGGSWVDFTLKVTII